MIRTPSVAGTFYPGDRESLQQEVEGFIRDGDQKKSVIGLISPHAGYIYSGACAGKGFRAVRVPGRVLILGVNHRGAGAPMAVDGNHQWRTPLGDIDVDTELREKLTGNSDVFGIDSLAASEEHSLEVQVPFIQVINPEAKIIPVTVGAHDRAMMKRAGEEIAAMIQGKREEILMVASTDMSHYVSADDARRLDTLAIEAVKEMDPDRLFDTVYSHRISMCGVAPTYIMMTAAGILGATLGEVIEYTHSGKTSGDYDHVVGYLSAVVR